MASILLSPTAPIVNLHSAIHYSDSGMSSTLILKIEHCQYMLMCLAKNTTIAEHTSTQNATVQVIEGHGELILKGEHIPLSPGALVFMPANAPHALKSDEDLAFLLTLSGT
jgi:nitric oxide dioxygenase